MAKSDELRNLIRQSGHKAYIISEKLGYSPSNIYHWLNGDCAPCARDMLRLAEILDVSVERIVRIFAEM